MDAARERIALGGLLLVTFVLRGIGADQPIVENYVGRQIPTAMVARNLERGSGFLRPELDTAPFPNLFLVEPPLYQAAAVGLRRASGRGLDASGRLVSALATTLGAWGLFGLARRREGSAGALLAVAAFAFSPLTIRYGRAFQPDAMMLGAILVGMRCWDEHEAGGARLWLAAGWLALAAGFALKVVWATLLIPLYAGVLRFPRLGKAVLAASAVAPALLWYLHAAILMSEGGGSRASTDNRAIWLNVLIPSALLRGSTWAGAAWDLGVRAFTPAGTLLAAWGFSRGFGGARLWRAWAASAGLTLAALAAKLHHEYYWLALAPPMALAIGRGLTDLRGRGPWGKAAAVALGGAAVVLAGVQSSGTWRTPREWASLPEAAAEVRRFVPAGEWVVAPEALLYASDRRGCRLEFGRGSAARAAGEWGGEIGSGGAPALVEFYRRQGARYFADVVEGPGPASADRMALHRAIRGRYKVLRDRPGVLLAALIEPEGPPNDRR